MQLTHGIHLGYCTNIHRGESWDETWRGLRDYTMRVRERVADGKPYGIGLRLSARAAQELAQPCQLAEFQEWLEANNSYVFTINGFPYGAFHGTRVKEQVFKPDWATKERLEYTCLLFDLLSKLLPKGMSGSVSTLPGSHKEFGVGMDELEAIFANLKSCAEDIERLCDATGQDLHLGLEPEPLGLFETSGETLKFFGLYVDRYPKDTAFLKRVGLNYDCCHLAIEFEEAQEALERITSFGIRLSKLHLSSALRFAPTPENRERLRGYDEPVYFHQVVMRDGDAPLRRFRDIPEALEMASRTPRDVGEEWRVHFHIPLHAEPSGGFHDTKDHLYGALDWLAKNPAKCQHLEMETYTWEVLPENLRTGDVVDQLCAEYDWTLTHHPIYSSGGRHGSEVDLRAIVEPMFIKHGMNVVFAGHEHFYERLKPQKGIHYFTAGGSAKLRSGDIVAGALTAKGFDTEQSFMVVEVDGDVMRFQAISRRGKVVDFGEIARQAKPETKP